MAVAIIEATYLNYIYLFLHLLFLCSLIYMTSTSFVHDSVACTYCDLHFSIR